MPKADLIDIFTDEGRRELDILTAKLLGYTVAHHWNTRDWMKEGHGWESWRLLDPEGLSAGDSCHDAETPWQEVPMFHSGHWTYELFVKWCEDKNVFFEMGRMQWMSPPDGQTANASIQKANAYHCKIWNDKLTVDAHCPTLLLAILEAWNDFHELSLEQENNHD